MKKVVLASLFLLTFNLIAFSQNNIRQIDFNNFTYKPYCAGEEPREITVRGGEFSEEKQSDDTVSQLYFKAFSISYGDLNGDAKDEAFVLTLCNVGSEGYISEGFVYTMKGDKPVLVTRFQGGDRAQGGLRSAKVEKGLFIVERYSIDESNNVCCPEFVVTTNYKWNGFEFVEVGVPVRGELYKPTPVSLDKGKNSAVVNVNLANGKFQRFLVKGLVGQTLTVSTVSKTVAFRMVRGTADVNENEKGFIAVLNDNGDFIIQVDNISGVETGAQIKIEVK